MNTPKLNEKFYEKYVLGDLIHDSMKTKIYKCVEISNQKKFIAKILVRQKDVNYQKKQLCNIKMEYETLLACSEHPNIINVQDFFEDGTATSIILDYCPNGDLVEYNNFLMKIPERKVKKIMKQILEALAYLHQKKIVHMDIKLENIFLDQDHNAILADFEFAFHEDDLTRRQCLRGTPQYLSPEMVERLYDKEKDFPSTKTDIWSAGICLFVLLVHYMPFSHSDSNVTFRQIRYGDLDYLRKDWDSVSSAGLDLTKRMLTRNPVSRISASEALNHAFFKKM